MDDPLQAEHPGDKHLESEHETAQIERRKLIKYVSITLIIGFVAFICLLVQLGLFLTQQKSGRKLTTDVRDILPAAFDPEKQGKALEAESKMLQAEQLASKHDYTGAHEAYVDGTAQLKNLLGHKTVVGKMFFRKGCFECEFDKYNLGQKDFEEALKSFPPDNDDPDVVLSCEDWLAYSLQKQNKFQEAVNWRKQIVSNYKDLPDSRKNRLLQDLGDCYYHCQDFKSAKSTYLVLLDQLRAQRKQNTHQYKFVQEAVEMIDKRVVPADQ